MARKTVLITGVSGFVGHHLAEILHEAGDFKIFGTILSPDELNNGRDLPFVEAIECRMEDSTHVKAAVQASQPQIVFHLAAQSSVPRSFSDPEGTFQTNVIGTLRLLEALRDVPTLEKAILISSAEIYGVADQSKLPMREDTPILPVNPYACSKACADLLGFQYFRTFGLPVVRLRPFNHIGPGQMESFAASAFAKQIAEIEIGSRPPKLMTGNLESKRDFTDVRDIVRAYHMAAEKCVPGEAYNICSGKAVSIQEILDRLLGLSNAQVEVAQDPERMRPSDMPITLGDCSKFTEATGWKPEIPLEQTLSDLLDYWRDRIL